MKMWSFCISRVHLHPKKHRTTTFQTSKESIIEFTQDEWNYLTQKFNISGIPHYVLVNKNGEVVNPKLGTSLQ